MLNQAIKFNGILFLFVALLFASCQKDTEMDENFTANASNFNGKGDHKGGGEMFGHNDCFTLVYPITIEFPDGTTADAADRAALKAAIIAWKQANPNTDGRPQFVMPYDITLEDGATVTITTEADIQTVKEGCRPDGDGHGHHRPKCFRPVFPVTINFPDGTSAEAADSAAFKALLVEWRTNHPDATEKPSIAFPFEAQLKDGTIVTVTNEEELVALFEDCRGSFEGHHGHHGDGERCFTFVFPLTINFPDGTTATANDQEALMTIKRDWYENNPDATERPTLAFPLDVTLTVDASTVTVNSIEELAALKEACED